ncbi:MAG: TLC domain-containing protein [Monoraphidium minutum]|nr:MAG: TLC domain-containing protein [Monoraphidium minutum]
MAAGVGWGPMEEAEQFLGPVPPVVWWCAVASFAGYAALFRLSAEAGKRYLPVYQRLSAAKKIDWDTRLPSTVHALVVSGLCLQQLLCGAFGSAASAADGVPPLLRATPTSWAVVGLSLGYFCGDAFMVICHDAIYSHMILVHHVVALAAAATVLAIRSAHAYLLFGLFTEVTTPFVNLRFRLSEAGASGGTLALYNGLAMAAVWAGARVAAFIPLFAHIAKHYPDARRYLPRYARGIVLGVPALLFIMNLLWFTKIVKGAAKMVAAARRRASAAAAAPAKGGRRADATVFVEAPPRHDTRKAQ